VSKCAECQRTIAAMGKLSPIKWLPFAWGSGDSDPIHFFVFPEAEKDRGSNGPEEVSATPICQVENPVARSKS
jgi:hypothetical protein